MTLYHLAQHSVYALWWLTAGQIPTVAEGKTRLEHLILHGDSPTAFTFGKIFSLRLLLFDFTAKRLEAPRQTALLL